MMNDQEFLFWLHERLEHVHREPAQADYMHKLRALIETTPADKATPNFGFTQTLDELRTHLAMKVGKAELGVANTLRQKTCGEISCDQCNDEREAAADEIDRLRNSLLRIKARCCGEAVPHWENTPATGNSRGWIADECDIALGLTPNGR